MGNKREIAESRIPELNTYMKVITLNVMHGAVFNCVRRKELLACLVSSAACGAEAYNLVG